MIFAKEARFRSRPVLDGCEVTWCAESVCDGRGRRAVPRARQQRYYTLVHCICGPRGADLSETCEAARQIR